MFTERIINNIRKIMYDRNLTQATMAFTSAYPHLNLVRY